MASSSSPPKHLNLNVAPKTTRDAKIWRPSFVSQNHHLMVNDSVMMNDTTDVIVATNFLTPMDEILFTGRFDEEAIDDPMAFSIQSVASASNMTRLDMLQISNEKILGDQESLMAKLKRRRPLPSEASRT
ncbi:unnamed protein product [Prunus brigantina]